MAAPAQPHGDREDDTPFTHNETPLAVEDGAYEMHSMTSRDEPPLRVWVEDNMPESWAAVNFYNTIVFGPNLRVNLDFAFKDLTIRVKLVPEPGNIPDTFTVVPPDGYIAIPETLVVPERSQGTILIFPYLLG